MHPSWFLADGTRVDLHSIANQQDLSLFAPKQWTARVNGASVPTDTRTVRGSSTENFFKLPDGREAIARVLSVQGTRITDLTVGDQIILDPGKWPFTCPSCRKAVEPHERNCAACKVEQPSYDARVFELQRRSVASSLLRSNLICVALGLSQILSSHAVPALASLRAADLTQYAASATGGGGLHYVLGRLAAYMLCIFGCAWLALFSPALAASLNMLAFACMVAGRALAPDGSWLAIGLAGVLMLATFSTTERALEISYRARQRAATSKA